MCEEQNNVSAANTPSTGQAVQPLNEVNEKQKQYYLEQARRLCPTVSLDGPEGARLWALFRKTKRIINMLTCFDRAWEDGLPEIQKACLHFLTLDNISHKERRKVLEKWSDWSVFLIEVSQYRSFTTQMLQYYYDQLHELESLVGHELSETPDF